MAGDARSGLKLEFFIRLCRRRHCLNGWGRPFGIETINGCRHDSTVSGLNGWGRPFGIETLR